MLHSVEVTCGLALLCSVASPLLRWSPPPSHHPSWGFIVIEILQHRAHFSRCVRAPDSAGSGQRVGSTSPPLPSPSSRLNAQACTPVHSQGVYGRPAARVTASLP